MKHRSGRTRLAVGLLVLIGVGTAAWWWWRRGGVSRAQPVVTAREAGRVTGSGTVEATEISLSTEAAGRLVEVLVDEGDTVASGQLVARLEAGELEAQLAQAEAAVVAADQQRAEVLRGTRSQVLQARQAQVAEAQAALAGARDSLGLARAAAARSTESRAAVDAAEAQWSGQRAQERAARAARDELRNGPRNEERAAARAALQAAAAGVTSATAELAVAQAAAQGAAAELTQARRADTARRAADSPLAAAETELARAQATLAAAQARRDLVEADPRPAVQRQLVEARDAATVALDLAAKELARVARLYEAGAVARARLDTAQAQHDQAQAALAQAEAALADVEAGARPMERREAAAQVAAAQAAVDGARRAVANARREQEVLEAGSGGAVARAQTALNTAQDRLAVAETAVTAAQARRREAQARLDLLLAGSRPERVTQAEEQVAAAAAARQGAGQALGHARQADQDRFDLRRQVTAAEQAVGMSEARLRAARAELDLAIDGSTDEQVRMAEANLRGAEAAAEMLRERLAKTLLRAPRRGTITEVVLREGEMVTPGAVVVRLLDLDRLWVRLYLPVRPFTRVQRGQPARVYTDAEPEQAYPGRVTTVSAEAEFTPRNTQTVEERVTQVFWVKVAVDSGGGRLKPGLPVDVVIGEGERAPALP